MRNGATRRAKVSDLPAKRAGDDTGSPGEHDFAAGARALLRCKLPRRQAKRGLIPAATKAQGVAWPKMIRSSVLDTGRAVARVGFSPPWTLDRCSPQPRAQLQPAPAPGPAQEPARPADPNLGEPAPRRSPRSRLSAPELFGRAHSDLGPRESRASLAPERTGAARPAAPRPCPGVAYRQRLITHRGRVVAARAALSTPLPLVAVGRARTVRRTAHARASLIAVLCCARICVGVGGAKRRRAQPRRRLGSIHVQGTCKGAA